MGEQELNPPNLAFESRSALGLPPCLTVRFYAGYSCCPLAMLGSHKIPDGRGGDFDQVDQPKFSQCESSYRLQDHPRRHSAVGRVAHNQPTTAFTVEWFDNQIEYGASILRRPLDLRRYVGPQI